MGSNESHFNVSVGVMDSHKTVSTNNNFFKDKGEPKRYRTEVLPLNQPNALPLGQTGSQPLVEVQCCFTSRAAISTIRGREPRTATFIIVQELCESRCGRPGLSVLTSFMVSVDVK